MDAIMDVIWYKIVDAVMLAKAGLDALFGPFNFLGPAGVILLMAVFTAAVTKILSRLIRTKRYESLRAEFTYWYHLRRRALACDDAEKARLLAKNIDQAELNKVYYNYFFEAFMLNLVQKYLPIFSMLTYVNEAYQAKRLLAIFGRPYVFRFGTGTDEVVIGAVFWFVAALMLVYGGWYLVRKLFFPKPLADQHPASSASPAAS